MALVTYILLSGMVAGFEGRFHPELLGVAASKSMGIVFVEFLIIKLGCYLLNIGGEGTVTDLLAYSGYKFVGIVVCLLSALLGTRGWSYSAVFVYVFCANALFLVRRRASSGADAHSYGRCATSSSPIRRSRQSTARRPTPTRRRIRQSAIGCGSYSASRRAKSPACSCCRGSSNVRAAGMSL